MKNPLRKALFLATASTAGLLAACGGGTSSDLGYGTLSVNLTDAPACGFDQVNVTVSKVRAHKISEAGAADSAWSEIVLSPARKIDLLALNNGILDKLGETSLPAGAYTQLRLVLEPNGGATPMANSVVPTGGVETALVTPSGTQSGIKLNGAFDVAEGASTELTLDFDACKSIVTRGNGSFGLKPVISIIPMASSGTISGFIDPAVAASAKPVVSAQVDGVVVKSTVPAASGEFSLAPLVAGTYNVVLTADAYASDVIGAVPVSAKGNTLLSTSASPLTMESSTENTVSGKVLPIEAESAVRATQTFAAGATVTIKYQNVDVTTGGYSMSLPLAAPRYAQYGTLPVTFTAHPALAAKYAIEASALTYQVQSVAADVAPGAVVQDFTLVK